MWECNAESSGCDGGVVDNEVFDVGNDGVVEDGNQVPVVLAAIIMVLPGMVTKMVFSENRDVGDSG